MGVTHINYKIAKCDICGITEQFEPTYSMPNDWNKIEDTYGLIRYKCVCPRCSKMIKEFIESYKKDHSQEAEGSEDD